MHCNFLECTIHFRLFEHLFFHEQLFVPMRESLTHSRLCPDKIVPRCLRDSPLVHLIPELDP